LLYLSVEIKGREHLMKTLIPLGLSKEQALLYITIMQHPDMSVNSIAKEMEIGRSKVYRLIDELKVMNLVNETVRKKGAVYSSKSYDHLKSLLDVKEHELKQLRSSFAGLEKYFRMSKKDKRKSGVMTYEGLTGLKQVIWNTTKAKNVLKVFEVTRINVFLDFGFAEDVRLKYVENNIKTKDLTNEEFIQGWTNIEEFSTKYSEYRYIDPKELEMSFEIYVYNDIVTLLDYSSDNVFCIEIQNMALKLIMEQLFDFVWKRAKKMKISGKRGEMRVV